MRLGPTSGARENSSSTKELTRACDAMAAGRRRMPWMPVVVEYWFEDRVGRVSLRDLFHGSTSGSSVAPAHGPQPAHRGPETQGFAGQVVVIMLSAGG